MRPRLLGVLAVLVLVTGTAACGSDDATGEGGKSYKIAMITPTIDDFSYTVQLGAEAAAKELGADFEMQPAPNYEAEASIRTLNAVAAKRPDAIIMSVVDAKALQAPLESVAARGIEIVIFDANVEDPSFAATFVANDYVESGRLIAKELDRLIDGSGETFFIAANPGNAFTDSLAEGYEDALGSTDLKSLPIQYVDGWDTARANAVTKATLVREPELDGMFVGGLTAAQGALPAIQAAGKAGDMALVEFDGTPEGIEHLESGAVDAIVSSPARAYGEESVRSAVAALDGKDLPPTQFLPACVITRETIDDPENKPCIYEKAP